MTLPIIASKQNIMIRQIFLVLSIVNTAMYLRVP